MGATEGKEQEQLPAPLQSVVQYKRISGTLVSSCLAADMDKTGLTLG